jgi:enoyl-CoA hydratase
LRAYDSPMASEVITEVRDHIGVVRLNRPDKLNALNFSLMTQVIEALEGFDADQNIRCMLLTGDERAFAAGADINEMADASMIEMYHRNMFGRWERIRRLHKPIVAAVSGYALGGGCELMMYGDIIIASETARFGQPEINLGVIPGAGGTQRLTRAIGKARAMDLILTGRMITAAEALTMGLVSRVVPAEHYFDEALKVCYELCDRPPIALQLAKEAIGKAFDTTLTEGLEFEKKLFYMLFATDDQKEGMRAFVEKRPPVFVGR